MRNLKHFFKTILIVLFSVFCFTGCDEEEMERDYVPVVINVKVADKSGNSLLNPDKEGNIFEQGITFAYNGEEYVMNKETLYPDTRAYLAKVESPTLVCTTHESGIEYHIQIGEWAGDSKWNESIVITWPDGTKNTISFELTKKGVTHTKYYLDGKEHKGLLYTFTYPMDGSPKL